MTKQWIDRHLDGEAKESAMVHEIKELRAKLAELEAQEPLGYTMTRPEEHAYSSHISYCRALEAYCDKIEAKLAEIEAHTKTLTQAAYAARLERDVAWQRCKELEAQEPKDGNSTHTLEQEPAAWLNTLRSNGYQEADMRPASNTDMWINEPLYKRGTP